MQIPKAFNKELSHSREYVFTDADENKIYTVYFFPQQGFFLGLKDFFAAHNIPQGTSMTLERKGPVQFHFWLKKSKKKLSVAKLTYDTDADTFADAGEVATLALPEQDHLSRARDAPQAAALYPERRALNLKDLLDPRLQDLQLLVGEPRPPLPAGLSPRRPPEADDARKTSSSPC